MGYIDITELKRIGESHVTLKFRKLFYHTDEEKLYNELDS